MVHLIHVRKEVFSFSTAPTVLHVLVPVWSLSLTGWEVLFWDSASASRLQLKHTPGLFQGKPATSGDCFFLSSNNLGSLMLLTTFSTEPYTFHKQQSCSNIVLVHGPLFQVRTKFFGEKWSGWIIFPGILVPRTNFFAGPTFL